MKSQVDRSTRISRFSCLLTIALAAGLSVRSHGAEPEILTPRPGPVPRINGAKVFGVRPGSPLLFKIPATGDRPLKYRVRGLPEGLSIDTATGQINGRIARAGTYDVVFEVANKHGTATRPFRIVCGPTLALTPHMGWNSWYVWENHVTDTIIREAADAMVRTGMIDHGYMYVNIDDCWAVKPGAPATELGGPAAQRARPGQPQPPVPRHEGPHRPHPRPGAEGGNLHLARATDLRWP